MAALIDCASWGWTMAEWEEIKREAEELMEKYQRELRRRSTAWDWLKAYFIRLGGRTNG